MGRFFLFAVLFIFILLLLPVMRQEFAGPGTRVLAQAGGSPCGTSYTVLPGDYLYAIAVRCQVTLEALRAANPQVTNPALIFPGQVLNVPTTTGGIPVTGGPSYTIQPGDTLSAIAVRQNTTVAAIQTLNPQITDIHRIFPGQIITLPQAGTGIPVTGDRQYTVVAGDTMGAIAARFNVGLQALINANPQVANPALIFPGQVLAVPAAGTGIPVTGGPTPTPAPASYTIVAGDRLSRIAQRYGVSVQAILYANPHITNPDVIFPGQVITIP